MSTRKHEAERMAEDCDVAAGRCGGRARAAWVMARDAYMMAARAVHADDYAYAMDAGDAFRAAAVQHDAAAHGVTL
jgi:hypothetical protein